MPYLHTDPIEREVAGGVAGDHDEAHTEVGIVEVGVRPGATPGVGHAAEGVGGFGCGKGSGCDRRCPCRAAVPGELHAESRRACGAVDTGIQLHFNSLNDGACGDVETKVR